MFIIEIFLKWSSLGGVYCFPWLRNLVFGKITGKLRYKALIGSSGQPAIPQMMHLGWVDLTPLHTDVGDRCTDSRQEMEATKYGHRVPQWPHNAISYSTTRPPPPCLSLQVSVLYLFVCVSVCASRRLMSAWYVCSEQTFCGIFQWKFLLQAFLITFLICRELNSLKAFLLKKNIDCLV